MKKILLLGGSDQQIIAIKTAKKLGYYTVLCDYLPDNPGQYVADKFYLISTTDKDAVLAVAMQERVDGILAYASDPAAPTAAYVAEKMSLPTNPYDAVDTLCNKDRFRVFLSQNGFNAPCSEGYRSVEEALAGLDQFRMPIIIKPVDSSGSKGITVLDDRNGVREALEFAFSFSRSHRVIVEEFIEKKHNYLIGGDVFVVEGKIVLWGLLNCHRDSAVNPLVPVGKSYPLALDDADQTAVRQTLQTMVEKLGIRFGAMNVELIVDKFGKVWPIDVGPRNGGNMIPDLLGLIFDVDVVEWSVKAAMGEPINVVIQDGKSFYATHNLHSSKNGVFQEIRFSPEIEKHIVKKCIYKKRGDLIAYFDNAAKALGILFLKFDSEEQMLQLLDKATQMIEIVLS